MLLLVELNNCGRHTIRPTYSYFNNAESAPLARSKTNNMDILGHKLLSSLQDVRNLAHKENDYMPECDSEILLSPDPKHEFDPIYNLVIAEEIQSTENL